MSEIADRFVRLFSGQLENRSCGRQPLREQIEVARAMGEALAQILAHAGIGAAPPAEHHHVHYHVPDGHHLMAEGEIVAISPWGVTMPAGDNQDGAARPLDPELVKRLELASRLAASDMPSMPKWGDSFSRESAFAMFTLMTEERDMIVAALRQRPDGGA